MQGLGPKLMEKLLASDIETVQELANSRVDDLTEIEGVGEKTAEKVLEAARRWLELHPPKPPAEVEFTPEMEKDEAMAAVQALETAVAGASVYDEPPSEVLEIEETEVPEDEERVPKRVRPRARKRKRRPARRSAGGFRNDRSREKASRLRDRQGPEMSSDAVVEMIRALGVEVRGHMSTVDPSIVGQLREDGARRRS
jgi:transcription termination factor NusA